MLMRLPTVKPVLKATCIKKSPVSKGLIKVKIRVNLQCIKQAIVLSSRFWLFFRCLGLTVLPDFF